MSVFLTQRVYGKKSSGKYHSIPIVEIVLISTTPLATALTVHTTPFAQIN